MSFGSFRQYSVPSFLDKFRDPDAFWFFMHIPKTAGSSFSVEICKARPKYRNIHADYSDPYVDEEASVNEALQRFLLLEDIHRYRSASGHLPWEMVAQIRDKIPNTRVVTMLRSPVKRIISEYRYQRTEMHPPYKRFMEEYPTLESYVETPKFQNRMARFIGGLDADQDELIRRVDEDFAFAGVLEMYPMSFNITFDLMGCSGRFPKEYLRKTPDISETEVNLTPELLARIRKLNRLDIAVYKHVRESLKLRRDEWRATRLKRGAVKEHEAVPTGSKSA